tara:strand:+ start:2199 stop:3908 length:1710 start_codon:yes stop_codon:yes gene_type:complete
MGFNSAFNSSGGSQILTDLEVDSPTVVVDETNDRVGIGTASPGTKLQVEDNAPYVTLKNSTSENSNGGCESKLIFEDHADVALGQIEVSHNGDSDDTKGKMILSTHTGSSLIAALTIDDTQDTTLAGDLHVGGGNLVVDTNVTATSNHTTVAAKIDYDATGIIATGQTGQNIGLDLEINSDSPTMVGTVINTGIDVDLVGGTSGTQTNIGLDISASGADSNYGAMITGTTADLILGTAGNANLTVLSARNQDSGTTAGKNLSISAGSGVMGGANNINGGDLILSTGQGDGTGTASMQFRTKVSGTDDVAERMRIHTDGNVGIGTAAPTNALHISTDSDAEFVALKLGNESDANDTTGKVSLQFDLEDTSGNAVDAAKFLVSKEAAFTNTASTQDAKFELQLSQNGTLGTKFTVESDGDITVPGDVNMTDSSAVNDENNNKLLKFCSVSNAVNYVEVENAADGTAPAISVLGDSTNITMSLKPKGTGGVRIFGSTTAAASLLFNEDSDNGTNFMKFQAAANIASNHTYTFPAAPPASPKILQSDSSGNLSWEEDLDRDDASLILHMQVFS